MRVLTHALRQALPAKKERAAISASASAAIMRAATRERPTRGASVMRLGLHTTPSLMLPCWRLTEAARFYGVPPAPRRTLSAIPAGRPPGRMRRGWQTSDFELAAVRGFASLQLKSFCRRAAEGPVGH